MPSSILQDICGRKGKRAGVLFSNTIMLSNARYEHNVHICNNGRKYRR